MKCIEKIRKTHNIFLKIEVKTMNNNRGFSEKDSGFERGKTQGRQWTVTKFLGKTQKGFQNWPICVKQTIFVTDLSRMQVAKVSCETLWNQNFWKFF